MSTAQRQSGSRPHNSVVLALLCLFAVVSTFAGAGERTSSVGASAAVLQGHAITCTDRVLSMQIVERKHAKLIGGGFPPALHTQSAQAQLIAQPLSLLPIDSHVAILRQRTVVSAQPRAPPAVVSARA